MAMKLEVIGIIAGTLNIIAFVPQILKICLTESARDISFWTFFIIVISAALWATYGIVNSSISIVFTNIVILVLSLLILALRQYCNRRTRP